MFGIRELAAAAAVLTFASTTPGQASDAQMVLAFYNQEKTPSDGSVTGSIPRGLSPAAKGRSGGRGGGFEKQIGSVSTACLKPELTRIIREASAHFGATAVITSGYRRGRHSYHGRCMAADVQVPGVSPGALARFFRAQPGVGGVGTYGHTRSVHVDVAPRRFSRHHGRRKRLAVYARA